MHKTSLLLSALRLTAAATALACATITVADDSPRRLQDALDAPGWLTVEGDYRARYESLHNTYRILDPGSDDLVASRFRQHARADGEQIYAGLELQDSREITGTVYLIPAEQKKGAVNAAPQSFGTSGSLCDFHRVWCDCF